MIKEKKLCNSNEEFLDKERDISLDILRILATLGVIILHTAAQKWYNSSVDSFEWHAFNFWDSIVRWTVPVFVMISGALFLGNKNSNNLKKLYGKNILHLLMAFAFWSAIYAIYAIIAHPDMPRKVIVVEFLTGHYHMWFILMIIGLYIIVPILNKIAAEKSVLKYFLVLSFCLALLIPTVRELYNQIASYIVIDKKITIVINALWETLNEITPPQIAGYAIYFLLGYYLYNTRFSRKIIILIYLISFLGFFCTIFLSELFAGLSQKPYGFYENFYLNVWLESVGVFVFFRNVKFKLGRRITRCIMAISKYSFGIYLVHVLILEALDDYWGLNTYICNAFLSVPVIAILVFVVGLIISMILNHIPILKKYFV